ncbi:MAG: indole-3-glycerol-phosphate synthase TrpC, partial [Planctomycetota bacterium]
MSDFLALMAERSRERADAARTRIPESELRAVSRVTPRPLALDGFDLIAEVKRTSPSAGTLEREGLDVVSQAR